MRRPEGCGCGARACIVLAAEARRTRDCRPSAKNSDCGHRRRDFGSARSEPTQGETCHEHPASVAPGLPPPSPASRSRSAPARRSAPPSRCSEQSASGLGNAFAGGAAFADDATRDVVEPGRAVADSSEFRWAAASTSSRRRSSSRTTARSRRPTSRSAATAATPAAATTCRTSISSCRSTRSGRSASASTCRSASKTEYDDGWLGRYQALKSKIKTINVNPALSWKVTRHFAIGVGVNYQHIEATLTNNVNYSGALLQAAAGRARHRAGIADVQRDRGLDRRARLEGDGHRRRRRVGLERRRRLGCHAQLRVGASYRSEIKYNVTGNVDFDNPTVTVPPGTPPHWPGRSRCCRPASTARRCTTGASPRTSSCRRSPTSRSSTRSTRSGT